MWIWIDVRNKEIFFKKRCSSHAVLLEPWGGKPGRPSWTWQGCIWTLWNWNDPFLPDMAFVPQTQSCPHSYHSKSAVFGTLITAVKYRFTKPVNAESWSLSCWRQWCLKQTTNLDVSIFVLSFYHRDALVGIMNKLTSHLSQNHWVHSLLW